MAARNSACWRSVLCRIKGKGAAAAVSYFTTTSTTPKSKIYPSGAAAANFGRHEEPKSQAAVRGEFAPVYVALGMIVLSMTLGVFTVVQHLRYSPDVHLKKSRRETLPEVEEPAQVVDEGTNLITKSFFRKVAHVQDFNRQEVLPDPIRNDTFARIQPRAVTLKSVGVEEEDPKKLH